MDLLIQSFLGLLGCVILFVLNLHHKNGRNKEGSTQYENLYFTVREYEKARREFNAAIDRGEKRELAPVRVLHYGNMRIEQADLFRTEKFKRQLTAVRSIREHIEKENKR